MTMTFEIAKKRKKNVFFLNQKSMPTEKPPKPPLQITWNERNARDVVAAFSVRPIETASTRAMHLHIAQRNSSINTVNCKKVLSMQNYCYWLFKADRKRAHNNINCTFTTTIIVRHWQYVLESWTQTNTRIRVHTYFNCNAIEMGKRGMFSWWNLFGMLTAHSKWTGLVLMCVTQKVNKKWERKKEI